MERVITRCLTWFLETNSVFSPSQTGYRQHRSTEDQLALLTQDIENSFQEKWKLLAVFFDLSKAFDRVWKKGLQWKLLRAGVSGQMYKWISSFLYHRVARVKLDGSLSREIRLSEGVPQGSVLLPTLFLLYVNDIVNTLPPRVKIPYVLMTWLHGPLLNTTSTATHVMQETINRVSSWADEWCMEINRSKTQATLFSLSTVKEKVMLKLEDMPVPQVDNPTFLGVTLDTHLTWKTHLEAVAARSVRKLGLLKKLAGTTWGADTNILRRVYTGAVRPIMEYATTSWATASNANKSKLDKVQNVALRAIVGAMKTTPIKEMEKRADLEPLELRRTLKVLSQTGKIRRLPGHPLHKKLAAPTKIGWKDRASTIWPGTSGEHMKIFLIHRLMRVTTCVVETGIRMISKPPSSWRYLVCSLLNNRYQHNRWPWLWRCSKRNIRRLVGHIYTPKAQRKRLSEMEAVACLSGPQQDKHLATQMLLAENAQISRQKPQHSRMQ